ncbi:unnamed protein product [Zymoseptoria tritici ST99CH_3D7]|uniref:GmrSD restriction endonucleases N-terminal domain-containing protein n=1 Tax=Zymoseptoria tritici (strain ST99CH_3D7) TaxID=1276538 RepID=A0A1X7RZX5_ZYMT9|nr:unnamed protein product [Zymoseptoria tritici ST99CH_3D7]
MTSVSTRSKARRLLKRRATPPIQPTIKTESSSPRLTLSNQSAPRAPDDHLTAGNTSDEEFQDENEDFNNWSGFQVSRALPRCDETKQTLGNLMALLNTPNAIDLDPEYQRGFCWNKANQVGLIDSILQGYYVPGVIFNRRAETVLGVRRESLVCIDGKQRLTSVKNFTDGRIPCNDRDGKKWWFRQAGDKVRCRRYLPRSAQQEFLRESFTCHQYIGMTQDQERELFQRVQRGSPLTPAERAQAKSGPWQNLARSFQRDFPRVAKLSDCTRGRGYDKFISSFAQIIEGQKVTAEGRNSEVAFRGTGNWAERYFVTDLHDHPCNPEQEARLKKVFDRFDELICLHPRTFANDGLDTTIALAPVEFIAAAYLVSRYSDRSNAAMEKAIRAMRRKVRQDHDDNVRRKSIVWKTLLASMQESFDLVSTQTKKRPPPTSPELAQRRVRQLFGLE